MKAFKMAAYILICLVFLGSVSARDKTALFQEKQPSKLGVLWTSGDRDVALNMVFMYTYNAKKSGWWDEIRFMVWGSSSKLLSVDLELQQEIKKMKEVGIEVVACKACADRYGISKKLEELGIPVKYIGQPLTTMLKTDWVVLTF